MAAKEKTEETVTETAEAAEGTKKVKGDEVKVRVRITFRDKNTKKVYHPGDELTVTKERLKELTGKKKYVGRI